MLVGGALVAGCTSEGEEARTVRGVYASAGGERAALRGIAVDARTHEDLVRKLGGEPEGIALTKDAPDGTVQVLVAPDAPLIATFLADGAPAAPPLSITFDDGTTEPVALLLPAIQKVREAAVHGTGGAVPAGTLTITVEGAATVGGVSVAAGDVTGDGRADARVGSVFVIGTHAPGTSPEQRTAMADAFVSPLAISGARLGPNTATTEGGFVLDDLALPDPYLAGRWGSAGSAMNLVVDVRLDSGVLTRFRIPRAQAITSQQQAKPRGHVKVFDGSTGALTRDGNAERAMFDAGYATFTSDALDQARRVLLDYATAPTMSQAILLWNQGRTQALADIVVATGPGGAPGYEAMACMAALPTALAVANGLDLANDANASAAATLYEAAATVTPKVGLVAGGTLALQTHGATTPTGDAELACAAVHQLTQLPSTLTTAEGKAIRALGVELAAFDARHLEIELAAWIDAMDAIVATPDETAWTAARAKADILIESISQATTRTEVRHAMAATLLGR